MLWIINCLDKPGSAPLRERHLAAHRRYLDGWNDRLFFSGPQQTDDGATAPWTPRGFARVFAVAACAGSRQLIGVAVA